MYSTVDSKMIIWLINLQPLKIAFKNKIKNYIYNKIYDHL